MYYVFIDHLKVLVRVHSFSKYALRVSPAETRLTVYRRLRVLMRIAYLKPQISSFWTVSSTVQNFHYERIFRKKYDKNDEKMNDLKSIQNHFGKVSVPPGHQKT